MGAKACGARGSEQDGQGAQAAVPGALDRLPIDPLELARWVREVARGQQDGGAFAQPSEEPPTEGLEPRQGPAGNTEEEEPLARARLGQQPEGHDGSVVQAPVVAREEAESVGTRGS